MTNEATDLLIRARGFIERGWCRDTYARDANGNPVDPCDKCAVSWSLTGAIRAAGGAPDIETAQQVRKCLMDAVGPGWKSFFEFNDRQESVKPILAAFDRAIAAGQNAA